MTAIHYQRPYLYPKQLEALFHSKRFGLVEASTKAGKTVGCVVWLFEQALQGKPGHQFWWVAPSRFQAKIAFSRLKHGVHPSAYTTNETELTINVLNGASIVFKTGEDPDKLYGEDVYAAVIDEASRVREEAWIAVRSTLTATRGPARIIGNVKGRKNWFYNLSRRAEKEMGDPKSNLHYAKIISHDAVKAGVLAAEEVEDARKNLPEHAFKELYLAEPADDGGNPFGGDAAIEKCFIPALTHRPVVSWGWDLAKSVDWTVGVGLDAEGKMSEFYRWQSSWRDTIRRIVDITGNSVPALVDATGVGDPVLEYLQTEGRKNIRGFKFSASSKQQLMEGLAIAIQQEEIGIVGIKESTANIPGNQVGIELKTFEYQYTRTGVTYGAPSGEHDDCVCGLALAWKQFRKPDAPAWVKSALRFVAPSHVPIFAR